MNRGYYTTREAARILGTNPHKIIELYNQDRLKGFLTPSGKHRRISTASLRDYLTSEGNLSDSRYINRMSEVWEQLKFEPSSH